MITEDVSAEQTRQFIKEDPKAFAHILNDRILPELRSLMSTLNETNECKQFEICLMDIQSMEDNLRDYLVNGPSAPFVKIDIKDSEIAADDPINMFPEPHMIGE